MQMQQRAARRADKNGRRFIGVSWAMGALAVACHANEPIGRGDEVTPRSPRAEPTYLVVYRPGPGWPEGKPMAEQSLREHGRYLISLHRRGVLRSAGPFADESGGAAVFEAPDDAAALGVVSADPTVQSEVFRFELRRWSLVDWAQLATASK